MPQRLFIPGPTPIPASVQEAMAGPIVYHRGPDFPDLLTGVVEDSKSLFPTKDELFLLSSSGTGAMEEGRLSFPCGSPAAGSKI